MLRSSEMTCHEELYHLTLIFNLLALKLLVAQHKKLLAKVGLEWLKIFQTVVFLAGNFMLTSSDTFAVRCIV